MVEGAALLDLVCGPVGPLPETRQRYRLVSHLGSGGQAEVYRAVRVSGGISSAPVTVKVFRPGGDRPMADQLRSWDKGDAVLMDLNSRGITGICRRADGFYAPVPHPPDHLPSGEPVPYQVLEYLHGVTLREYVAQRYGTGGGPGPRLDAVATLSTLASVLTALHLPYDPRACPVLHMDVKPSNVMVLTGGEVRLIDFTGARYYWRDHITSVAYTAEAGGPEAFSGNVGPAYDVHGFGAVAYYLVTGAFPRIEGSTPDGTSAPPWAVLRGHPLLDANPGLREHLLAPVADRPEDRPGTGELQAWVRQLAELVRSSSCPDAGVSWGGSEPPVTGRATVTPVAGTETGAFQRIEKLERELVALRSVIGEPVGVPVATRASNGRPAPTKVASGAGAASSEPASSEPGSSGAVSSGAVSSRPEPTRRAPAPQPAADGSIRGVAAVPARKPEPTIESPPPSRRPEVRSPKPDLATVLNRGSEITGVGVMFAFVCWGIWAVASGQGGLVDKALTFGVVLLIGVGVFVLSRLVGRLIWEKLMGRVRRTARGAHTATAAYLVAAGLGFLQQTPWVVEVWTWLKSVV